MLMTGLAAGMRNAIWKCDARQPEGKKLKMCMVQAEGVRSALANFPAVFSFPPSPVSAQTFSLITLHATHGRLLKIHGAE
jgi:hypothetical protein